MSPTKPIILSLLFCLLIWFIWSFNLKPLFVNKEINWADYYVRTEQCQKALEKMETEVLPSHSIIDSYAKLKYIDIIGKCNAFSPKAISVLKEVAEIRPFYTRTWIFLGKYTNILIENKELFKINNTKELKKQTNSYFEKALQLSPRHEEIFLGLIQTDLISGQYQSAKEKIQKCLNLNPKSGYCWWSKIISNLYLSEIEEVHKDIESATKKGVNLISKKNLSQFEAICQTTKNIECFKELTDIYYSLMVYEDYRFDPEYHFDLIYISTLGEKEEILKQDIKTILGTWPELESKLKNILDSLNKIDKETVNQYINNTKKLMEIENDLKKLNLLEPEIKDILTSKYEYKINEQIKLIN